jgi:hypothetical protein
MYSALGRFKIVLGILILLGVTHSEGFVFVGSPFVFTLWAIMKTVGSRFTRLYPLIN